MVVTFFCVLKALAATRSWLLLVVAFANCNSVVSTFLLSLTFAVSFFVVSAFVAAAAVSDFTSLLATVFALVD